MDIHEQIASRMAKERIEGAVRAAEQMRAVRAARARHAVRVRLGSTLMRLGFLMVGRSSPAAVSFHTKVRAGP